MRRALASWSAAGVTRMLWAANSAATATPPRRAARSAAASSSAATGGVVPAARQGEVAGPAVGVGDDVRQPGVQRHALDRVGAVEDHRGEQGMGEADRPSSPQTSSSCVEGVGDERAASEDASQAVASATSGGRTEGRSRAQHRQLSAVTSPIRAASVARSVAGVAARKPVAGVPRAGELDGEQRVAAGQLADAVERPAAGGHRRRRARPRRGRRATAVRARAPRCGPAGTIGDALAGRPLGREDARPARPPAGASRSAASRSDTVSSHCRSSIASTTGASAARRRSVCSTARPRSNTSASAVERPPCRVGVLEQVDQAGHRRVQLVLARPSDEDPVTGRRDAPRSPAATPPSCRSPPRHG